MLVALGVELGQVERLVICGAGLDSNCRTFSQPRYSVYSGLVLSLRSAPVYFLDNKLEYMVYKTRITFDFIDIIEKKARYSCLVLSLLLFAILGTVLN